MSKVIDRDLGMDRIFKELRGMKGAHTKIGVQAGSRRTDPEGVSDLVTVAVANEFGSPADAPPSEKHTPERSFIRSTYDDKRENLAQAMVVAKNAIVSGRMTTREALDQVGLLHTAQVIEKINSDVPPENAPSTIEQKGSSGTLRDTKQLAQSIRHLTVVGGRS
jgi:hypothetical protein